MKSFLSLLLLFWVAAVAVANEGIGVREDSQPGPPDHATHVRAGCNFDDIMAKCGDIYIKSIDDFVYGVRVLRQWETNVVSKVRAYAEKLRTDPYVEGRDNPDVAIAYAFMHYICFEPLIEAGQEHKIYECMLEDQMCARIEGIEAWCEGMNA
jgi:hypothetical protein